MSGDDPLLSPGTGYLPSAERTEGACALEGAGYAEHAGDALDPGDRQGLEKPGARSYM